MVKRSCRKLFRQLKNEWVQKKIYETLEDAKKDIFNYIEVVYDDMVGKSLQDVECEHIHRTLELTGQNRTEAAKILQIGERTLYRKIKEYGL